MRKITYQGEPLTFDLTLVYIFAGINFASQSGYVYDAIGNYTYHVNVSNLISEANYTIYLPVQIVIERLTIIQPPPVAYGEPAVIYMKMDAGSHVEFSSSFGGLPSRNFSMSDATRKGYVILEEQDYTCTHINQYFTHSLVW